MSARVSRHVLYKVHVGISARRFTSDLRDAFVDGVIVSTPYFNSVNRSYTKNRV